MSDRSLSRRPLKLCDIRYREGKRRRALYLEAIAAGLSEGEACTAAGWSSAATIRQVKRRNPGFADGILSARYHADWVARGCPESPETWSPFDDRDPANLVPEKWRGPWPTPRPFRRRR
jgi:hypothetical protein